MAVSKPKVVFFTTNDHGQANVQLAVASALHQRNEVSVHIVSQAPLEARVRAVQALHHNLVREPIHFHVYPFPLVFDAIHKDCGFTRNDIPCAPGLAGLEFVRKTTPLLLSPWTTEDTLAMYDWCCAFWEREKPDLCVLEPYALGAFDMCRTLGKRYLAINPCSLTDALAMREPWGKGLWGYPS